MVKLPRHSSLALIAMMASVINAQCAVSCSLQVDPDPIHHACCPSQGAPKPGQQPKDEVPCPHPAPTADQARLNNNSANLDAVPIVVGLSHDCCPQLPGISVAPLTALASSGLSLRSSISILRI